MLTLCEAQVVINPRWEDYEISYVYDNPFAALGMGHIEPPKSQHHDGPDLSEYIQPSNVDPKWVAAMNGVQNGTTNGTMNGATNGGTIEIANGASNWLKN